MDPDFSHIPDAEGYTKVKQQPWMASKKFILGTAENLPRIVDECIAAGRFGLDTETSGLDSRVFDGRTRDELAGVCFAPSPDVGYYCPLNHYRVVTTWETDQNGEIREVGSREPLECNIPWSVFDREMGRLVDAIEAKKTIAVFHNAKFDQEFLQFNGRPRPYGTWEDIATWEDTQILAVLRNSRARRTGLKALTKAPPDAAPEYATGGPGLGFDMIELHELWGHDQPKKGETYDFRSLDPAENPACVWYAASDPICTLMLYHLLANTPSVLVPDQWNFQQGAIYKIEKLCLVSVRWMERNRIFVNKKAVLELIQLGQKEWMDSITSVYQAAEEILKRDVRPAYVRYLQSHFTSDPVCYAPHSPDQRCTQCGDRGYLTHLLVEHQVETAKQDALSAWGAKENENIYDISSAKQLGDMFEEMKVPGLKHTLKSGQVKTSKDEIERILKEAGEDFPFMKKVRRFREVHKALSTYLYALLTLADPNDGTIKINFRQNKVDTGRFCTPADEDAKNNNPIEGIPEINFQAIPSYDASGEKRPVCMGRLRECFTGRKRNTKIVAVDYAGEELRLIANFSREPKFLREFFHCADCDRTFPSGDGSSTPDAPPPFCPDCGSSNIGDLHTLTALAVYGADVKSRDDFKSLRSKAKGLNFAMAYGGGASAAMHSVGCSKQEGQRIKTQYDSTYPVLHGWWKNQHKLADQRGYVFTAWNRKYPVPDIHHQDGFFRSKAQRNATNGPIQGSGADIIKIAMGLVWKECRKRGWLDRVKMIATMHDELVFEIEDEILEEALLVIVPIMCRNIAILSKKWPVPFTCDVEFGDNWSVPYHLEKCKHKQNKGPNGTKIGFPPEIQHLFPILSKGGAVSPTTPEVAPAPAPETPAPEDVKMPEDVPETASPKVPEDVPETASPKPTKNTLPDLFEDVSDAPAIATRAPSQVPPTPTFRSGDTCDLIITAPLDIRTLQKLAEIIVAWRGTGTQVLRLYTRDGTSLDAWKEIGNDGEDVLVSGAHVYAAARMARLCL